ncbi:hypothetical protein D3C76_793670 [compost metagenome]
MRPQPIDEATHRDVAVATILEHDPEAPVGQALAAAGDADGVVVGEHRRVAGDDLRQLPVLFRHVGIGNVLGGLGGAEHEGSVLHREEALGNADVARHRQ